MAQIKYLAQLDGLRALAVLAVIVFHSRADWLPGGYVGVDVFFFLSGFLITQIVVRSLTSGKFSYLDFIAGRLRRLFPAYAVMVCACLLVAPLILLPGEFERLAETALASLLFLSNIFFYQNLGYFDAAAEHQLLLHTWSLAVEWQFYLAFPLVLWAAHRLSGRVVPALVVLAIASLMFNLVVTPVNSQFTFFMFPPRAWELIAGGLLGLAYMNRKLMGRERTGWTVAGVLLLAASVALFDETTLFPGIAATLPTLATGILVFNTVRGEGGLLTSLLSSRLLVLIGQMSYSLYLWHWPVLLYARFYFGDHLAVSQLLLCWTITIGLSYLSWRWVESALRRHRWWSLQWRAYAGAVAMSLPVAVGAGMVMLNDGYGRRLPDQARELVNIVKWPDVGRCSTDYKEDQYHDCTLGSGLEPATILIWGDSHAQTLIWAVTEIAEQRDINIRHVTKGGCPPVFYGVVPSTGIDKDACLSAQKAAWRIIDSDPSVSTVLISARWPLYEGASMMTAETQPVKRFEGALSETINALLQRDLNVILVDSLPEPGFDVSNVLARRALLEQSVPDSFQDQRPPFKSLDFIKSISDSRFSVLRLNNVLCSAGHCPISEGGEVLYFDGDHLARAGASKLAAPIENALFPDRIEAGISEALPARE
ncbi:acyltransferase family protein [Marinobacter lacisalsi]|uniref:Acyltransferase family protein n=1 Tax=Marinobacter lacisalsi TaxID=475979 RepID=A0ABV8QHF8_9GAMM